MLQLTGVVIRLLLQPHRLSLVEPVAGGHEFFVCHLSLYEQEEPIGVRYNLYILYQRACF